MAVTIGIETPLQDDVRQLVLELNTHLLALSPPEFCFQMTVEQMAGSATTLFVARDDTGRAVGMGALKVESAELAEVKRMYTRPEVRGRGIGVAILAEIVGLARAKGISVLMLETGEGPAFTVPHALYEKAGFVRRGPFLDYPESPYSAFFEQRLDRPGPAEVAVGGTAI